MVDKDFTGVVIDDAGNERHYKGGVLHRDGDLPAELRVDGIRCYRKKGKIHRDGDLPAVTTSKGTVIYYQEGKPHREKGRPALIQKDGSLEWWEHGKSIDEYHLMILLPSGNVRAGCFTGTLEEFKERLASKERPYSLPLYEADLARIEKQLAEQENKK